MTPESGKLTLIRIKPRDKVNVARVCAELVAAFPGSRITGDVSFVSEREHVEDVWKQLEARDRPDAPLIRAGFDMMNESSRRRDFAFGPGKKVAVKLNDEIQMLGQIRERSINFRGPRQAAALIDPLLEWLRNLQMGTVEVL